MKDFDICVQHTSSNVNCDIPLWNDIFIFTSAARAFLGIQPVMFGVSGSTVACLVWNGRMNRQYWSLFPICRPSIPRPIKQCAVRYGRQLRGHCVTFIPAARNASRVSGTPSCNWSSTPVAPSKVISFSMVSMTRLTSFSRSTKACRASFSLSVSLW